MRPKKLCWILIGIGAVTPLIVGLVVKFYLMSLGVNTVPFSSTIYILPIVLYWAIPFVLFAGFAYTLLSWPQVHHDAPYWKRALIVGFGAVFGWCAMVVVFWFGWQDKEGMVLGFAPFIVGGHIVLGLIIGLIIVMIATFFEQH